MINVRPRLRTTAVGVSGHSGAGAVNDVVRLRLEANPVCVGGHIRDILKGAQGRWPG